MGKDRTESKGKPMRFDEDSTVFDNYCDNRDLDPLQREVARDAWNAAIEAVSDVLMYFSSDEPGYAPTEKGIEEVSQ